MSSNDNPNKRPPTEDAAEETAEPNAKRIRTQENSSSAAAAAAVTDIDFSALEEGPPDATTIDRLVNGMLHQLEHIQQHQPPEAAGGADSSASSSSSVQALSRGLLLLRSWQRDLIQQSSDLEVRCQEQCQSQQRHETLGRSLQYETNHLQQEIAQVQDFSMPHLDQVLEQRRQKQQQQSTDDAPPQEELEPNNPNHRKAILGHLKSQIKKRYTLEKHRDRLQRKLVSVQQKCQQEQNKLKQLPKQLATLEAATKPLQQWFNLPYIGTARTERLKLAEQLPAPLYTLFVSLQEHLDLVNDPANHPSLASVSSTPPDKMSLQVVPAMGSGAAASSSVPHNGDKGGRPHEVQWSLPVLDVSALSKAAAAASSSASSLTVNSNKRTVTIHFATPPSTSASAGGPRCIQANVSGSPISLDQKWLLTHLFPNEGSPADSPASGGGSGGFYPWCHYLAGIHLVPCRTGGATSETSSSTTPSVASTRAIVQTLQRRIRANATLKYILQSLQNHKIPAAPSPPETATSNQHSSSSSSTTTSWQVVTFLEQPQPPTENSNGVRSSSRSPVFSYDVHCKKTISKNNVLELRAMVQIDKARYPSVPPQWQISSPKQTATTTAAAASKRPLYNGTWSLLEQKVNQTLLLPSFLTTPNNAERAQEEKDDDEDSKPRAASIENGDDKDVEMVDATAARSPALPEPESEGALLFAEWILVHQLNRLLNDWERVATDAASVGVGSRAVRGRDRVPISLEESKE